MTTTTQLDTLLTTAFALSLLISACSGATSAPAQTIEVDSPTFLRMDDMRCAMHDFDAVAGFDGTLAAILPDKNAVLFVANEHLWKADLSGSPAVRLVEGADRWVTFGTRMTRVKLFEPG